MHTLVVVNLKGGCGKTTVATHLAARLARMGHRPTLIDLDRQQSSARWVERRDAKLPIIDVLSQEADELVLPKRAAFVVLDVPAGLRRKGLEAIIDVADAVVVPVLPGVFDEDASAKFLAALAEQKPVRKGRRPVAVVGNRIRRGTAAERRLDAFLEGLSFPAVAKLSESQHYVSAAETGVTVFDQPVGRVRKLLDEWRPLTVWLDEGLAN